MANSITWCAIVICFVALVLTTVASFTTGWVQYHDTNFRVSATFGLLKSCFGGTVCVVNVSLHSGAIIAAMVQIFLLVFLALLGFILLVVGVYNKSPIFMRIAGTMVIVGGWGQFYNSVVQFYFGLFQSCSTSRGCRSNTHEHSGATIAAMVFMFLSFFLTLLGLILMVVSVYEKSPLLMRIAGSFDIVGGQAKWTRVLDYQLP
ncbi:unnamed protein product [Clavelina lepadiformis]|uniref:Uncharacterized protein n=1 Tax=Clavelina lepadiformis TaxID=159417 RepID=A0ABP0EWM9_CLALP